MEILQKQEKLVVSASIQVLQTEKDHRIRDTFQ